MSSQTANTIFLVAMLAAFYFLLIRPQQQRAKKQGAMISALAPGDEIVTVGGIFATIVSIDDRLRVRLADGSEMEIAKQAVSQLVGSSDQASRADQDSDSDSAEE